MPIAPLVGASLISSGANLLGGLMGNSAQSSANKTNIQIAREANAANQQLQKEQNQWNVEQWNRENDYNSASSQRQRLEAAGMNPFLTTQQIAQGNASTNQLTSAPYTPTNTPTVQPVTALAQGVTNSGNDFVNSYLNMRMGAANVKKAEAEANLATADAAATTGYKGDLARSQMKTNEGLQGVYKTQADLNDIRATIERTWGSQQAVANLELTVANKLKAEQDRITSSAQARNLVAQSINICSLYSN